MKFNFKKIWSNAKDSVITAGAGVAANALVDAATQGVEALAPVTANPTYLNLAKVALGAVISSSTGSNSIINKAGAGLATVGASNLAASLMEEYLPNAGDKTGGDKTGTSGVPFIGATRRMRMGQRGFRNARVRGTGNINGIPFASN